MQQYIVSADHLVSTAYGTKINITQFRISKLMHAHAHVHVHVNNKHVPQCIQQNQLSIVGASLQLDIQQDIYILL